MCVRKVFFTVLAILMVCILFSCSNVILESGSDKNRRESPSTLSTPENTPEPLIIPEGESFAIIMLPDSQGYLTYESKNDMFKAQTDWIVENKDTEKIVYVIHVGDIIGSNSVPGVSEPHWQYAKNCMDELTAAGIPYGTVPGNHDLADGSGRDLSMYNDYFPLSGFENMSTFGGSYDGQNSENMWHTFSVSGESFLVFLFEFGPRDEVLQWAGNIIEAHPGSPVIAATHGYLEVDNTVLGPGDNHSPTNGYGINTDGNCGTDMWDKLFSKQEDMFMVLCGHTGTSDDGAGYLASENDAGFPVHQVLANYQYFHFSNSGYIRIIRFFPSEKMIEMETYSPSLDIYMEDSDNHFIIEDIRYF